jgi:uncharacterized protein (DUF2147 family)
MIWPKRKKIQSMTMQFSMLKFALMALVTSLLVGGWMSETSAQSGQPTLVGRWKTIDDETGRVKSIVEITERNGVYTGRVVELFRLPGEDPQPKCTACEDDRKGKPVMGMEVVRGMRRVGSKLRWEGGTICDPKNGSVYDCEMWIDPAKPQELKVRGYLYFLYRTQTWIRV